MEELHHLLLLPPAIGADLEHCLMMLSAAPSTSETELSLNVPFDVGAQVASSASTCARCAHRGCRAMRLHRLLIAAAQRAAVRACRQAGALEEGSPALRPGARVGLWRAAGRVRVAVYV